MLSKHHQTYSMTKKTRINMWYLWGGCRSQRGQRWRTGCLHPLSEGLRSRCGSGGSVAPGLVEPERRWGQNSPAGTWQSSGIWSSDHWQTGSASGGQSGKNTHQTILNTNSKNKWKPYEELHTQKKSLWEQSSGLTQGETDQNGWQPPEV